MENQNLNENRSNILNSKKFWIIIGILFLIWFGYSIGKQKSWDDLTPQQKREGKANCYQWYGKACDDPNFNPE